MSIHLTLLDVELSYDGSRGIFAPLSCNVGPGTVVALTGKNGAGKSSLMSCIAGLVRPWKGRCDLSVDGATILREQLMHHTGYAAPSMALYEEFNAIEHLEFDARMRALEHHESLVVRSLQRFGLFDRRHDIIGSYSTGMRQRMKLVTASYFGPSLLLLDEPTSNLDDEGFGACEALIRERSASGGIVIIATNDDRERALATMEIRLQPH